jgi:hypothetical protein
VRSVNGHESEHEHGGRPPSARARRPHGASRSPGRRRGTFTEEAAARLDRDGEKGEMFSRARLGTGSYGGFGLG